MNSYYFNFQTSRPLPPLPVSDQDSSLTPPSSRAPILSTSSHSVNTPVSTPTHSSSVASNTATATTSSSHTCRTSVASTEPDIAEEVTENTLPENLSEIENISAVPPELPPRPAVMPLAALAPVNTPESEETDVEDGDARVSVEPSAPAMLDSATNTETTPEPQSDDQSNATETESRDRVDGLVMSCLSAAAALDPYPAPQGQRSVQPPVSVSSDVTNLRAAHILPNLGALRINSTSSSNSPTTAGTTTASTPTSGNMSNGPSQHMHAGRLNLLRDEIFFCILFFNFSFFHRLKILSNSLKYVKVFFLN